MLHLIRRGKRAFVSKAPGKSHLRPEICFHHSARHEAHHTNPSLDIDDSMRDVLNLADMGSLKTKGRQVRFSDGTPTAKELEVLEYDETWEGHALASEDHEIEHPESTERKSFRATFGSHRIGSVYLPLEMRNAVDRVVDGETLVL